MSRTTSSGLLFALGTYYADGRLHCGAAQVLVRFKGCFDLFVLFYAVPADAFVLLLFVSLLFMLLRLLVLARRRELRGLRCGWLLVFAVGVLLLHVIKATALLAD